MFIDEIQAMQERGEQLRKLRSDATDTEFSNLQRQLALLDAKCRAKGPSRRPPQLVLQGTDGTALVRVQPRAPTERPAARRLPSACRG
jgi:hypothetical protein